MTYTIKQRESNIDDYSQNFHCQTDDWRTYLGDKGWFLGQNLKHSRIDYFVYKGKKLIFDTANGYHDFKN